MLRFDRRASKLSLMNVHVVFQLSSFDPLRHYPPDCFSASWLQSSAAIMMANAA